MPSAAVNGATLHYDVVGDGPTCLVVPGWPGVDHAYLRPGLDRLGRFLRLVYYDHRPEFSMEQAAADAAALQQRVGDLAQRLQRTAAALSTLTERLGGAAEDRARINRLEEQLEHRTELTERLKSQLVDLTRTLEHLE